KNTKAAVRQYFSASDISSHLSRSGSDKVGSLTKSHSTHLKDWAARMSTGNLIKLAHDRALYQGHLANTAWHRHGAPVLLVGLGRGFRVHLADGRVEHAQSAL